MSLYTNWPLELIISLNLGHKFTKKAILWQLKLKRFICPFNNPKIELTHKIWTISLALILYLKPNFTQVTKISTLFDQITPTSQLKPLIRPLLYLWKSIFLYFHHYLHSFLFNFWSGFKIRPWAWFTSYYTLTQNMLNQTIFISRRFAVLNDHES